MTKSKPKPRATKPATVKPVELVAAKTAIEAVVPVPDPVPEPEKKKPGRKPKIQLVVKEQ